MPTPRLGPDGRMSALRKLADAARLAAGEPSPA